jgi:hypothetical protein
MPKRRDKSEPPGGSAAGTMFLLFAAGFAAFPELRSWPLVAANVGVGLSLLLVGSGRVYRPAVTRAGDTITCRFNPWREAAFYFILIGLPGVGVMSLEAADRISGLSPGIWRLLGLLMFAAWLKFLFIFVRQSRQSLLRISPSALAVQQVGQQTAPTEIPRGAVEEITATTARLRNNDTAPTTQISYQARDSGPTTHTVLFGPTNTLKTSWLTVEQSDLLGGLQAWKDADPDDPGLMDRVEAILRGQAPDSA